MSKARIVEIVRPDGEVRYEIQQKHWLFRWMWVGAGCNSWDYYVRDSFLTLKEAKKNLCWFDGTQSKAKVICECEND